MPGDEAEKAFEQAARLLEVRQFRSRTARSVGNLVGKVLTRHSVAASRASDDIQQAWQKVSSASWNGMTRVGSVKRGKLEITVGHHMLHQQLIFEKENLLQALNRELPQAQIQDLVFRVGSIH